MYKTNEPISSWVLTRKVNAAAEPYDILWGVIVRLHVPRYHIVDRLKEMRMIPGHSNVCSPDNQT